MDTETIQILAKASNLAGLTGQNKESIEIAEALCMALPDDENSELVRANAYLHAGRFDDAAKVLRERVLERSPDDATAKTFLGLALHAEGRATERDRVLQEVIDAKPGDEATLGLAQGLLHR